MNDPTRIRRMNERDIEAVVRICNATIARGESTYGPDPVDARQMHAQLLGVDQKFEAYVFESDDSEVLGWAAITPHTSRPVYNVSGEVEVFVAPEHRRRGIGRALMARLLSRAEAIGYHALLLLLQPVPTPPLAWAIRLGFRSVGSLTAAIPVGTEWRDLLVFERFVQAGGAARAS